MTVITFNNFYSAHLLNILTSINLFMSTLILINLCYSIIYELADGWRRIGQIVRIVRMQRILVPAENAVRCFCFIITMTRKGVPPALRGIVHQ